MQQKPPFPLVRIAKIAGLVSGSGFAIAVPIFLGRYLDSNFNTGMLWTYIGLGISFAVIIATLAGFVAIVIRRGL